MPQKPEMQCTSSSLSQANQSPSQCKPKVSPTKIHRKGKKNTNTPKYMVKVFWKRYRHFSHFVDANERIKKRVQWKISKQRLIIKKRKFDNVGLEDLQELLSDKKIPGMNSFCRQVFALIMQHEAREIPYNQKIALKKEYMLSMKLQALRSRHPSLISRNEI